MTILVNYISVYQPRSVHNDWRQILVRVQSKSVLVALSKQQATAGTFSFLTNGTLEK